MSVSSPSRTLTNNLVFCYDVFNEKSYVGEPTTNLCQQVSNFTGSTYASSPEWTSTEPTKFQKTYNPSIITPIGVGATLCFETSASGYRHLSTFGGAEENSSHSISCYVYPLDPITNFTIGMLVDSGNQVLFDFTKVSASYGGSIANRNAFIYPVKNYPGWFRVGANIEGRSGGWIGAIGLQTGGSYTPSPPYKSFYITGILEEDKPHPTQYAFGARGNTAGLLDLTRTKTINLTTADYSSSAELYFNGSSSYVFVGSMTLGNQFTICAWINPKEIGGDYSIVGTGANGCDNWFGVYNSLLYTLVTEAMDLNNYPCGGSGTLAANAWNYVCLSVNTNVVKMYINGKLDITHGPLGFTIGAWTGDFAIGRRCPDLSSRYFYGKIDQVSCYNAVLSDIDILNLYNKTKSRYGL